MLEDAMDEEFAKIGVLEASTEEAASLISGVAEASVDETVIEMLSAIEVETSIIEGAAELTFSTEEEVFA